MVRDSTKIAVLSYARAGKCLSGLCGATVLTKPLSHYANHCPIKSMSRAH